MLDKFYTKPVVAERLFCLVKEYTTNPQTFLEPSAGNGVFLGLLTSLSDNVIAFDISPDASGITQADFLSQDVGKVDVVIGNPPFGKNSSLAVKFFNKCAEWQPEVIAFVLPRTFKKPRFWERLDDRYSLAYSEDCPKDSFLASGVTYDVPCCLQVWIREPRTFSLPKNTELLKETDVLPSIFVRRVGGRAGRVVEEYTKSSTYQLTHSEEVVELLDSFSNRFNEFAGNTSGVKSITLHEMEDIIFGRYECLKL